MLDMKTGRGLLRGKKELFQDLIDYRSAKGRIGDDAWEIPSLFKRFLTDTTNRKCLRLLAEPHDQQENGSSWVSMDLEAVERDARQAGKVSVSHESEYFDIVLCTGLDRVSRPASLVAELWRVLRPGGQIWVQVPLNAPYDPEKHEGQTVYWRITPEGLRILFEKFDEIRCAVYLPRGSALRSCSFFYGLKPVVDASEPGLSPPPAGLSMAPF